MLNFLLSHYDTLLMAWIILAFLVFPTAIIFNAPYGRHVNKEWGILIDNRLGWLVMEAPTLIVLPLLTYLGSVKLSLPAIIMVSIYILHYINRVLVFPLRLNTSGKKIPLAIVIMAGIFNVVNGTFLGLHVGHIATYEMHWLYDIRFIIGLVIMVVGAYINIRADNILIALRKPGETGYAIPTGFLFTRVSCPNHLGEIIEWLGFGIMLWALPGFAFSIWTAANLIPRAINHHQWYKQHFNNYPTERKAVLPYFL